MYIYIYIYIYSSLSLYIYIYTYTHTHYVYNNIIANLNHLFLSLSLYIYIYMNEWTNKLINQYVYIYIYIYIYTYVHPHIHTTTSHHPLGGSEKGDPEKGSRLGDLNVTFKWFLGRIPLFGSPFGGQWISTVSGKAKWVPSEMGLEQ